MKYPIKKISEIIAAGELVVLPTDTLYGLVASALNPRAIKKIYRVKKRDPQKPLITLIASKRDLKMFGLKLTPAQTATLKKLWPGPTSVIIKGQAFRLPALPALRLLLRATGPLVAPSANPEGLAPAKSAREAEAYFGSQVALYVAGPVKTGAPSTLLKLDEAGQIELLRSGARPPRLKKVK
jgi:L-threonylcarbamoyladenylate synthase